MQIMMCNSAIYFQSDANYDVEKCNLFSRVMQIMMCNSAIYFQNDANYDVEKCNLLSELCKSWCGMVQFIFKVGLYIVGILLASWCVLLLYYWRTGVERLR